jgi:hypothetical protein
MYYKMVHEIGGWGRGGLAMFSIYFMFSANY